MTRLIVQSDNQWAKKKIRSALEKERMLLKRAIQRTQIKLEVFEQKYGKLDGQSQHGKIDDMVLLEWEGEVESMLRLKEKLKSFEEITFER